jgi:hypothetical protein
VNTGFIPRCGTCGSDEQHDYSHSAERQAEVDDQFVRDVRAAVATDRAVATTITEPMYVIKRLLQILERAGY